MFKDRYEKFKLHVKEHKEAYIVGAVGVTVIAGVLIFKRRPIIMINNTVAPVINNVGSAVNNGSYARKIVRCLETDQMWPSMSKAAEAAGHTIQTMSKHIHGHTDHLDGLHYVIEGVTAG